jgi:hypothetical protein
MVCFRDVAFPKKKGAALKVSQPYVKEVYANLYPTTALPKGYPEGGGGTARRSVKMGQIGHISYHSIPSSTGWVGLLVLGLLFGKSPLHNAEMKLVGLVGAFLYTLAESAFTKVERGESYTSLAQFLCNVVYMPILLQLYPAALSSLGLSAPVYFVLLYPLNIWVLEILQHTFILIPIWGRNVAWCYLDYADELLGGVIRVGHAPAWWALGTAVLVGKRPLEMLVQKAMGNAGDFKLWE